MRIWIVEATEPLPIDEGERSWRCGMLSAELVAAGHEVLWWSSTFDHVRKLHRCAGTQTITLQPGLSLFLLHGPGYRRNVSFRRIAHNRALAKDFAAEARQRARPDLAFCCMPTPELAEQCVNLGRRDGFPLVIDVRDLWPDSYLNLVRRPLRQVASLALIPEFRRMRRICVGASALTAVSDTYLDWALAYAGRVRTERDGVFPLAYVGPADEIDSILQENARRLRTKFELPADATLVTFCGAFGATYDLETVIEAARTFGRRGARDLQFVLAGDGERAARLKAKAKELTNVTFTGWLDQASIRTLLAISSIGLAPYVATAPQSLPNKPYEYMASGLPLISSLGGELRMLVEREKIGISYAPGDVDSLVQAIDFLRANSEVRQQMASNARRLFMQRFSGDIVYPRLVRHLETIALNSELDYSSNRGAQVAD